MFDNSIAILGIPVILLSLYLNFRHKHVWMSVPFNLYWSFGGNEYTMFSEHCIKCSEARIVARKVQK